LKRFTRYYFCIDGSSSW